MKFVKSSDVYFEISLKINPNMHALINMIQYLGLKSNYTSENKTELCE